MRHAWTVGRRELGAWLGGAGGWVVLAAWLAMAGVLWFIRLDQYTVAMADQVHNPYAGWHMNLTDQLLAPWFGTLTVLLLLICPALTMRLFAGEVRGHTLELLLSSPAPTAAIVVGKYLGALSFLGLLLTPTVWMPASLWLWGRPDPGAILGGYLGLLLFGGAALGLGLLASALTDSPVVALVLGFAATMCLYLVGWVDPDPTSLAAQLSLANHLHDLLRGGLRVSDVAYYLLLIAWCLFATHQRVEAHRYT